MATEVRSLAKRSRLMLVTLRGQASPKTPCGCRPIGRHEPDAKATARAIR